MFPLDAKGWSIIPDIAPSARAVYVSSSAGNDSNAGTIDAPVKTIEKGYSLLRNGWGATGGSGDRLYLKKGDEWTLKNLDWKISGVLNGSPAGLFAYGTGPRPKIWSSGSALSNFTSIKNVVYYGVDIEALNRNYNLPNFDRKAVAGSGIEIMHVSSDILVEDCRIAYFQAGNITIITGQVNVFHTNLTFRRNVIEGAWGDPDFSGQGIYAEGIDGLNIHENFFHHNGWTDNKASMYRHNMYLQHGSLKNVSVKGNVVSQGSNFGCQLRSEGVIEENFFYDNAVHASVSGVNGSFLNNVCVGGHNIVIPYAQPLKGGIAMNALNTTATGNLFVDKDDTTTKYPVQALSLGTRSWTPAGPRTAAIKGNITYNWTGYPVGTNEVYHSVVISDNVFQSLNNLAIKFDALVDSLQVSNNVYHRKDGTPSQNGYAKGQVVTDTGSVDKAVAFANPQCWVPEDFTAKIVKQSKDTWDDTVTAAAMNKMFRDAFAAKISPSNVPVALSFSVYDGVTSAPIANPIAGDLTIDLKDHKSICFCVNTSAQTGSYLFEYEGQQEKQSSFPYAFPGDNGMSHLVGFTPTVGQHTIKVTPSSNDGTVGAPLSLTFKVVDTTPPVLTKVTVNYSDGTADAINAKTTVKTVQGTFSDGSQKNLLG